MRQFNPAPREVGTCGLATRFSPSSCSGCSRGAAGTQPTSRRSRRGRRRSSTSSPRSTRRCSRSRRRRRPRRAAPAGRPEQGLQHPATGLAGAGTRQRQGHDRRVLGLPVPVLRPGRGAGEAGHRAYPKDVRLVYKQFPLTSIHPNAMPASKAALAAGRQGKFWEMHHLIFDNQRQLGPGEVHGVRREAAARRAAVPEGHGVAGDPGADQPRDAGGKAADVTGTPTIFVNGKRLMNRSFDGFKQMIEASTRARRRRRAERRIRSGAMARFAALALVLVLAAALCARAVHESLAADPGEPAAGGGARRAGVPAGRRARATSIATRRTNAAVERSAAVWPRSRTDRTSSGTSS